MLQVNAETIKCIFMSTHQTARQNHNIKTANESSGNVATFRYLRMRIKKAFAY
jgi:hypothetical protein